MIGIVADDTTGANDIGIMFTKSGYKVKVLTYEKNMKIVKDVDVLIIDTDSRLDKPDLSYQKVTDATSILQKAGCTMFYKKTCSVFRGNIGIEFDAMLDTLNENFAIILLAFPKNGRKTINSIHTVYGKRLEDSEFAKDPVHPTKESNLVSILNRQTKRKVTGIYLESVRKGASFLKSEIEKAKKNYNYIIIDAETQSDIYTVAEAVKDYKMLGGSSAIGEELPKVLPPSEYLSVSKNLDMKENNGVLVVSGSLTPQTKEQTALLTKLGFPTLIVDSRKIINENSRDREIEKIFKEAKNLLSSGKDILIEANNETKIVKETKELGKSYGMDELVISKKISDSLAQITKELTDALQLKRIVIAGGDTSGTVCRKLGIKGNYIISEIQTGVPSGLAIGRKMLIVLKSGSFGKEDFLVKAVNHLKGLTLMI